MREKRQPGNNRNKKSGMDAVFRNGRPAGRGAGPGARVMAVLRRNRFFLLFLGALAALEFVLSVFLVSRAAEIERDQMLALMYERARALVWTLEGGARFLGGRGRADNLPRLLEEVGRQPGIAWIALVDKRGRIVADSNPAVAGLELYTPEEMARLAPGNYLQGRFSPDDPDIYETWQLFNPGRLYGPGHHKCAPGEPQYVFLALDASDFVRHIRSYISQLTTIAALGSLATLIGAALVFFIYQFLSSRRKLADARALSEQVVRNFPAAIVLTDGCGEIVLCNSPASRIPGIGRGRPLPEKLLDWAAILAELDKKGVIQERESEIAMPEPWPVSLSAALVRDSGGKKAGYLFVLRDMAELRRLQEKLRQSERLSALGSMAAGVAHEIRNPLSSIRGYAVYLSERLKGDPLGRRAADIMAEETERLNRVLTDLLAVAKTPRLSKREISLEEVLRGAAGVAAAEAQNKGLALNLALPQYEAQAGEAGTKKAMLMADPDRLRQAVLNLLINAVEATDRGGRIELALQKISPGAGGRKFWRISVSDTGRGMDEKAMAQAFTPYFSTKAAGTGLGLPIVQQIAEAHGGSASLTSRPGQGSTFYLDLPAEPEQE